MFKELLKEIKDIFVIKFSRPEKIDEERYHLLKKELVINSKYKIDKSDISYLDNCGDAFKMIFSCMLILYGSSKLPQSISGTFQYTKEFIGNESNYILKGLLAIWGIWLLAVKILSYIAIPLICIVGTWIIISFFYYLEFRKQRKEYYKMMGTIITLSTDYQDFCNKFYRSNEI